MAVAKPLHYDGIKSEDKIQTTPIDSPQDNNRLARFFFKAEVVMLNFTEGRTINYKVLEGIPEGAELVSFYYDPSVDGFFFVVRHESFELSKSYLIPERHVLFDNFHTEPLSLDWGKKIEGEEK